MATQLIPGLESNFTSPISPDFNEDFEGFYLGNFERSADGKTVKLKGNAEEVRRHFGLLFSKGIQKYVKHLREKGKLEISESEVKAFTNDVLKEFYSIDCDVTNSTFNPVDFINRKLDNEEVPSHERDFINFLSRKLRNVFTKSNLDKAIRATTLKKGIDCNIQQRPTPQYTGQTRHEYSNDLNYDAIILEMTKVMFTEDKEALAHKYSFKDFNALIEEINKQFSRNGTFTHSIGFNSFIMDMGVRIQQNDHKRQSLYNNNYQPLYRYVSHKYESLRNKIKDYESIETPNDLTEFLNKYDFNNHLDFYKSIKADLRNSNIPQLEDKLFHFICIYRDVKAIEEHKEQQQNIPRRPRTTNSGTRYSGSQEREEATPTPESPEREYTRTGDGNQNDRNFTSSRSNISKNAVLHTLSYEEILNMYHSTFMDDRPTTATTRLLDDFGLNQRSYLNYLNAYKQDAGLPQSSNLQTHSIELSRIKSNRTAIQTNRGTLGLSSNIREGNDLLIEGFINFVRRFKKSYQNDDQKCKEAYARYCHIRIDELNRYLQAFKDDLEIANSVPTENRNRAIITVNRALDHLSYEAIQTIRHTVGDTKFMKQFDIPNKEVLKNYMAALIEDGKQQQNIKKAAKEEETKRTSKKKRAWFGRGR